VRHHGEEARLGAVGGFRLVARFRQRQFGFGAVGDVAADALDFDAAFQRHGYFAPGDPAGAVGCRDLLVVHARAVGGKRAVALLQQRQGKIACQQRIARASGKPAESIVGVSDMAGGVTAQDEVTLRFQEAARAFLRFLQLPGAVGEFFRALLQALEITAQHPVAPEQRQSHPAGENGHGQSNDNFDGEGHGLKRNAAGTA
jgi:hypothetical protein